MSDVDAEAGRDSYLENMKTSRDGPATLKLRLITLRMTAPKVAIIALEGDDDKLVYAQWIKRLQPRLEYEPFPCKGKDGVLALFGVVQRDLADLKRNVYFFVDRDFDDLRGLPPDPKIFMTDFYAVENYIVSDTVLSEILRNEFHCHEKIEFRDELREVFAKTYAQFLSVTKELNSRIYIARRSGIKLKNQLPTKINTIAQVELKQVAPAKEAPEDKVVYFRLPSKAEIEKCSVEFNKLKPEQRYRGKFALLFFQRWLAELVAEFEKKEAGLFGQLKIESRLRVNELSIGNFASKSDVPSELPAFLEVIAARQ